MTPEYFKTEGFALRVIKDVGWPFSSDKYCCSCEICGGGVFMMVDEPHEKNEILVPVHDFCFDEAKIKYEHD